MTDERPKLFDQSTPRPAPPELRPRTLSAIDRELTRQRKPRWERAFELAVAASLVLGVGVNVWHWRTDEARQARLGEPGLATQRSTEHDSSTAALRRRGADLPGYDRYQLLLQEFAQGRFPESL